MAEACFAEQLLLAVPERNRQKTLPQLGGTFADFIEIGQGGKIYSGKSSWDAAADGWIIELSPDGTARMRFGNADNTKSLTWDGENLVINGAIVVNSTLNTRFSGTMTRGSNSGVAGYSQIAPFTAGSLSPQTFQFAGRAFRVLAVRTLSTNLLLRVELVSGSAFNPASNPFFVDLECSLGTFARTDATYTDNSTYWDWEWSGAGTFPGSGTETVTLLT